MVDYNLYNDELYHHGIKGMKWGVRRYQNKDGSYTNAGLRRNFKAIKRAEKKWEYRMGGAVGKDDVITSAADKVRSLGQRVDASYARLGDVRNKQEQEDRRKYNKFYSEKGRSPTKEEHEKMMDSTYLKYKKDIDALEKEVRKAKDEYDLAIKQTVDAYLGKYGDIPVKRLNGYKHTAAEALSIQIEWGNGIRNSK